MSVRARGPPGFSALWTAWNYLTVTLSTGSQSHRLLTSTGVPTPLLTIGIAGFAHICLFQHYLRIFWGGLVIFFTICCHFLALVGHVFAISDETEVPVRVQLYVCRYVSRWHEDCACIYKSPCFLVWECWCSEQKCDNSVNKQTSADYYLLGGAGYFTKIVTILEKAPWSMSLWLVNIDFEDKHPHFWRTHCVSMAVSHKRLISLKD